MKISVPARLRGVLAISSVVTLLPACFAGAELPFTQFTPEAGPALLPSSSVQKVGQDCQGYVWLAFFSTGLGRYNGHSITTHGSELRSSELYDW